MSDYEVSIEKALEEIFPVTDIVRCIFNFALVSVLYVNSKYVV